MQGQGSMAMGGWVRIGGRMAGGEVDGVGKGKMGP